MPWHRKLAQGYQHTARVRMFAGLRLVNPLIEFWQRGMITGYGRCGTGMSFEHKGNLIEFQLAVVAVIDTVILGLVGEFTHRCLHQFGGLADVTVSVF